uniref:Uncharacterized protein n=1 Tax=Podoviridae sp. ct8Lf7 TaxID=2827723 RepID=A0A8S5S0C7_9CAUD|nr:MAG TPA: hypothetical protein [Podoviridae sp. ct8Lf7]
MFVSRGRRMNVIISIVFYPLQLPFFLGSIIICG